MSKFFYLLILLAPFAYGQNLSQSFPAGKGATYKLTLKSNPGPVQVSMYVAGTRVDSIHIEYYMETGGLLPTQMWQQFEIGVKGSGSSEVRKGYILAKHMKAPEILPAAYLAGAAGGVQVNDFLFKNKNSLEKNKIGEETIEIAAGTTKATHYRIQNNGQTVDFWISDNAKPLGLVLLTSKSETNANQNYGLELTSLIDNVKPKILPESAIPLKKENENLLARPESLR